MDNNFSRYAKSFLEVKLRRLRRKMNEGKYDTRDTRGNYLYIYFYTNP